MRDCPSRRRGPKPKPGLQRQIINFVDNTINVIAKVGPLLFDFAVMRDQRLWPITNLRQRIYLETQRFEPINRTHLCVGQGLRQLAPRVGKKPQRPRAGDFSVQLAQGTCGCVARIGK